MSGGHRIHNPTSLFWRMTESESIPRIPMYSPYIPVTFHRSTTDTRNPAFPSFLNGSVQSVESNTMLKSHYSNLHQQQQPVNYSSSHAEARLHHFESDQPMDLSLPKSPNSNDSKLSYLEQLLTKEGQRKRKHKPVDNTNAPLNLTKRSRSNGCVIVDMKDATDNPVQLVQLVPNQAEEITQRVSQSLVEMVFQVFTTCGFKRLCEDDKVSLILNSWHRLMLWQFAKNGFSFQVSTMSSSSLVNSAQPGDTQLPMNQPSMAFVKSVASFIKRFQALRIEDDEFSLLFGITLFHCGQDNCIQPQLVEQQRKELMKDLRNHVAAKKTGSTKRYADLLLYLPQLYGINEKMFEKLFFNDLLKETDMKLLLKEAIKRISDNSL